MARIDPKRGEIWRVKFPQRKGQEIGKERPAVVMNAHGAGRADMRIVIPITTGRPSFTNYYWMTGIRASLTNGLQHDSFADASQVQAVSLERFGAARVGIIDTLKLQEKVAASVALAVGHRPRSGKRKRK